MVMKKSTVVFGVVVVALLIVCVGLLVALLKNQKEFREKTERTTPSEITQTNPSGGSTKPTTIILPNNTDGPKLPFEHYRLPDNIKPLHYDLTLQPNLETNRFEGSVKIEVVVSAPTSYFIVHAFKNKLTISSAKVTSATGAELAVERQFTWDDNEYYVLEMSEEAPKGRYYLDYEFNGSLEGSIVGFYKSTYYDTQRNDTISLATSKFQPTYARRAYPCFDEPNFKSKFTVTLIHDAKYNALSNMDVENVTELSDGLKKTKFRESVPMVTYLTCFIVSDFQYQVGFTATNKIEFRVYSTPHQVEKTKFALETGIKILDYYEEYFGIKYQLPKSDMIAIPDFSSGAMEHWGLITYRETNLLYDESESSPQNKQRVASVISHELAHMWFGNLVTMEWWDDLWLNEGFASYIEYKGVNHVYPDWMMMDQILTEDMQSVIRLDATTRSHPIIQEVNDTDEITEIFDAISYNKGAAVLRMLENFVGEQEFQKGISSFLKKYMYMNAKTVQLWDEMSIISKVDIAGVMDTWTRQMGLPYVTAKRSGNTREFDIFQKRFLLNPQMANSSDMSPYNYEWKIPLSYVTSEGKKGRFLLNSTTAETITIDGNWDWVKFNEDQTGYYIVNYGDKEWSKFSKIFLESHEKLSPSDRAGLLFDAFQLAQAEQISYKIPLKMTTYLMNERHLTPWETAYSSFVQMGFLFQGSEEYEMFKSFLRQLTQPLYRTLGWKQHTKHTDSLLQTTIIGLACYSGNDDCRKQAVSKLKSLQEKKLVDIPLALRSIVYKYAIESDTEDKLWDFVWDRYMKEESAQEKVKLLYGLSHSQNPKRIEELIKYAKDTKLIRSQDFFTVLNYIAGNPVGRPIVWQFVRDEWHYLVDRFTINDRYLGRTVKTICDYFTTETQLKQVTDFFEKYPHAGAGQRARYQALENIQNNIRWLGAHRENVFDWLRENSLPWSDFRLSDNVVPRHYDLTLEPDLDGGNRFKGKVKITVDVLIETNHLIVHADPELKVTKSDVKIVQLGEESLTVAAAFAHKINEFWVVETSRPIYENSTVDLYYEFEGFLNLSLVGLYKSSYVNKDNETRYLVTTQFQSTHARKAFPCFDEPKFKSTFTVTLIHPQEFTAVSNMQVDGAPEDMADGRVKTTFLRSVKMVTYLVCVTISDFGFLNGTTKNGVEVKVYSKPDEVQKLEYALKVGIKTLDFFEEYFNIPYPLKKLDMIAIPDFQSGAMENWGIITYRETLLIYDEKVNSPYNQFRVAAVIGHEIAHMWFGNLVTMKWWDDLWLNEGFASYMEYKSMDEVEPDWEVNEHFFVEDMQRVLLPDAATTSHPIVQKVNHPDEITALFDAISYSKGASVLRMLEFFLGQDVFQRGVSAYLKKFEYDNAVTADLWHTLSEAQDPDKNLNISEIMDTWTRQMGYPVLKVSKLADGSGPSTEFKLQQRRFLIEADPKKESTSPFGYKWSIPVSYKVAGSNVTEIKWMNHQDEELIIMVDKTTKWTKFNADLTGYYLVDYAENWPDMQSLLESSHEDLSASDRANLISDAFLLARAGQMGYGEALGLTKYLTKEKHFVPWQTAHNSLAYLMRILQHNKKVDEELKGYLDSLTFKLMESLGWETTGSHLERRLRETIVDLACDCGNYKCLQQAGEQLRKWKDGEVIPADLKLLVFKYGMREIGDEEMWNSTWTRFAQEKNSQEQRNLLFGLANTKESALLNKLLEYSEDTNLVRSQDYFTLLGYVAANPVGLPIVWNYVTENWEKLVKRFTISDRYLGNAVKSICNHFTTAQRLSEMREFFAKYPEAGAGERSRQEALSNVENNIKWLEKYQDNIHTYLKDQPKRPWYNVRLTEKVIPEEYKVRLHPDIDEGGFTGSVDITVNSTEATKYFLVHIHQLKVSNSKVKKIDESGTITELKVVSAFEHPQNNFWVVELSEEVEQGKYVLSYEFSGSLLNKLYGFYRSSYIDKNTGITKHMATSQFQSTYARQAFPCFDEPSIKSVFVITLVHKKELTALSNMDIDFFENVDGLEDTQATTFKPSPKMVTYLVAVIVSDFKFTSTVTNKNTTINVYAPPDRIEETGFALKAGRDVLEYFEKYFDIPYPLPKLDMIAIPDFRAGAMENWGLITYREAYLLFNENTTSPANEFSIVMIVAHEIAHMWFGNLVTMKWWDDLWLNEGFATFMSYKCVDNIRNDMNAIGLFLLGETADVLEPDATLSSHPIVQAVNHPDEISAIFDAISYSKGSSVLRKLETYLTPPVFQQGISRYLNKYEYANAVTDDLWTELQEEADSQTPPLAKNVKKVMDTWTKQMGYPYLTVKFDSDLKKAAVSQERFLLNPESSSNDALISPFNYTWEIPIQIGYNGKEYEYMLDKKEDELDLEKLGASSVTGIKFNSEQSGYYLVNYEEFVWNNWAKALRENSITISSNDKSNLLSDAFLLSRAGHLNYSVALELTKYLIKEDDFIPWTTAKGELTFVSNLIDSDPETHAQMTKYLRDLTEVIYNDLGWDDAYGQEYLKRRLRSGIADLACKSGNEKCLREASQKLVEFIRDSTPLPSALRSLVFRYGLSHDDTLWEPLWNLYLTETSSQAQRDLIYGLAYSQNEEQLKNYIELAKTHVRSQDFLTVVTSIANNPKGLQIAWDFIREEWDYLVNKYTINDRSLGSSVLSICSHFKTKKRLNEMNSFFGKYPDAGAGKSAREEALEVVQGNIKWVSAYLPIVREWLRDHFSS